MASLKKSINSRKKFSASGKRPLKKRGPYKPRVKAPPPVKPESSPLVDKLRQKIQETKAVLIPDSISSPISPPPPSLEPPDSELEKLRKEKEKADYSDREKVRKSKFDKKRGKRGGARPAPTKEGVLALLRLPFQVGGAITGFNQEPIHPTIEEPLAESALAVLNDFGFEAFQKWINLGVFAALYGTCGLGWFTGLQDWAKEQRRAAVEAKKGKIHDITPPGDPKPAEAV